MNCNDAPFFRINWVQKLALYETRARFFIVGSNNTQSRIRVLKIDRTEPQDLVVIDDRVEYTHQEIEDLLNRVNHGNRGKNRSPGIIRKIPAYGIFGFIRFLEGYYLILITKRRRIAQIGSHAIYKIEDTAMVYIPNVPPKNNPDEARYFKMFNHIDLNSNFYFSYTYDLTHTLQYNLTPYSVTHHKMTNGKTLWETNVEQELINQNSCSRTLPNFKYVWNEYMLQDLDVHPDWLLYIVHGFVSQGNICVYGRPFLLTLIARRSQKFAGTRFLKRGSNCEGYVGNEVETEQILADAGVSSFRKGKFTSFVQMRGSIPSYWSQDVSTMVPKPTITLDVVDPLHRPSGRHFNQLLTSYGSPVIVLDLVKKKEQKPHESVLYNEVVSAISYLNQFLPPQHRIEHIGFDMARMNKRKGVKVMERLADISYYILKKVGIFQSWPNDLKKKLDKSRLNLEIGGLELSNGICVQTGIARVNCVDCLDRTNTAQFALGKCALAFQLFALGVIKSPVLQFETDTVRLLEELYEIHGNTLALQYGGSQLVHRIETYRKTAPLTSHSRDFMQTLSRYYSNTFSDWEKQNAINLFLGVFKAYEYPDVRLWDLSTDYYLHNSISAGKFVKCTKPATQWWDEKVAVCLPRAAIEIFKNDSSRFSYAYTQECNEGESKDEFYEHYKPYELTVFMDTLAFQIPHTQRDMPNCTEDYSPFCIRMRPGKRLESFMSTTNNKLLPPSPSLSGNASTSSTSSSASELESDYSDDETSTYCHIKKMSTTSSSTNTSPVRTTSSLTFCDKQTYGTVMIRPKANDLILYENYVKIGSVSEGKTDNNYEFGNMFKNQISYKSRILGQNSSFEVKLRKTSAKTYQLYDQYVKKGNTGIVKPKPESIALYNKYVTNSLLNLQ